MVLLFPLEEQLDGFDVVLADGVKQPVRYVDAALQKDFDQLETFVLDGDDQRCPSQRISAVDVQIVGPILVIVQQTSCNNISIY